MKSNECNIKINPKTNVKSNLNPTNPWTANTETRIVAIPLGFCQKNSSRHVTKKITANVVGSWHKPIHRKKPNSTSRPENTNSAPYMPLRCQKWRHEGMWCQDWAIGVIFTAGLHIWSTLRSLARGISRDCTCLLSAGKRRGFWLGFTTLACLNVSNLPDIRKKMMLRVGQIPGPGTGNLGVHTYLERRDGVGAKNSETHSNRSGGGNATRNGKNQRSRAGSEHVRVIDWLLRQPLWSFRICQFWFCI